ncbi:polysaccharide deacetylase family protein [Halovivax sp.]|uniref:polysaccharide deacetylase family protein n=1 Tax=Halovivax sp. TaxID=1935978 RepID=UPI0025C0B1A6|nr:polysaccharide deacetylase family protein [Halovivax sp.]
MRRRTYLATATVATLGTAGCLARDTGDDESDGSGEDEPEPGEEPPADADTWDDFDALDDWEASMGSLSGDDERTVTGSQAAHVEVNEVGTDGRIVRSLDPPLDCSGVVPGMAVASEHATVVVIQLLDADGESIEFRQRTAPEHPFVRRNFGFWRMAGGVDLERIVEIRVSFWVDEDHAGELWVDDFFFVHRPERGAVLVQFDGGYEEDYTRALPILERRELPATTFVATDRVRESLDEDGDRLTEDQLGELADAGWTVGSHGARGLQLPSLEADERASDVAEAADWLDERDYDPRYLSFPGGRFDEESYEAVGEHHDLAFAGDFPASGHVANPHLCPRVHDPDPQEARDLLEVTAEVGAITSVVFHRVGGDTAASVEALATELRRYVDEGELEAISPATLAEEYVH